MNRENTARAFAALADLVSRLRGPEGCPWDAEQTYDTIKAYLLEEAYEVVDAVDQGLSEDICSELGDLLFQILFLASIAEDKGEFNLFQVLEKIRQKMIKRHPHVFGTTKVAGPEEVAENWEKIKRREAGASESRSAHLERVPENLPALLRTHRLTHRDSAQKRDASNISECWRRVEECYAALGRGVSAQDSTQVGERVGDLLFSLADMARCWGHNAEHLLRRANRQFLEKLGNGGRDRDKCARNDP